MTVSVGELFDSRHFFLFQTLSLIDPHTQDDDDDGSSRSL